MDSSNFIFQNNNDPNQNINAVKAYLDRKTHNGTLSVIDSPPKSLDQIITEAVCDHLDDKHNRGQPTSKSNFEMSFTKHEEPFLRSSYRNYKWAWTEFRWC